MAEKRKEDFKAKGDISDLLQRLELAEKPRRVEWDDVSGLQEAKEALREEFIFPLLIPDFFTGIRTPWNSVLLFGPPGTGKTLLAHALATEVDNSIFIPLSNCCDQNERLLEDLLVNRRTQVPTIIFIDKIDVLFNSESARRMKEQFLTYMEQRRVSGPRREYDGILILATSSQPWLIDKALLKRFQKRIYATLPNMAERLQILRFCLGETPNRLTEENLEELAKKTERFSGGDISALVQEALKQPKRKVEGATHYKRVSGPSRPDPNVHDLLTPCSPGGPEAKEISWQEIPSDKLLEPVIDMCDMLHSLARSKPIIDEHGLMRYKQFQESFW